MKYILFRFLKENINNANCNYCKKVLPINYVGLSYRDGKGYIKTHKFHDICAIKKAPNLTANFVNNSSANTNSNRIKNIAKTIQKVPLHTESCVFNEYKWWNSGHFYDIELNVEKSIKCGLSNKPIKINELVIRKPIINYGNKSYETFFLKNALLITDFDWANFEERLKTSLSKSVNLKNQLLEKLNQLDNPKVESILDNIKVYDFPIYGLEIKRCKKELMCWDIYFKKLVSVSEQNRILEKFKNYYCTWVNNIHLEIKPIKEISTKVFKDSIFIHLKFIENTISAAHFCKKGDYRQTKALVYEQNNLIPYPFLFFNHNGFKNNPWELYIKFLNPILNIPIGYDNKPLLFKKNWLNKNLSLSKDSLWIKISGGYWDNIEHQIDEELYLLHDTFKIEAIILNDFEETLKSKSHWNQWSYQSFDSKKMDEFNKIKAHFKTTNQNRIEVYDMKKAFIASKECYNHAHEMGDPSSALEALLDIIEDVPYELRKTKEYKKIVFWKNELIDIIT